MGRVLCSEIAAQDKHPWLCGYSLGGRLAMQAVLAHPPLWKGAVFVSANPGLEDEAEKAARRAKDAEWAVKCLSAPWEDFLKEWDAQGVFEGGPPPPDRSSLKPWRKSISRRFHRLVRGRPGKPGPAPEAVPCSPVMDSRGA